MAPWVECPICCRQFRQENLSFHVEDCLKRSSSADAMRSQPVQRTETPSSMGCSPSSSSTARALAMKSPSPEMPSPKKKRKHPSAAFKPLAERMRPQTLKDLVGQEQLLGKGTLLSTLIQSDRVPNMILWGPPGCGKTTLAHIISSRTNGKFLTLSGATSNLADMRDAVEKARGEQRLCQRHTIVFVDEIHRFKKNQQDFFLPVIEDGTITLIGATTENPSFEINHALLSRCRVYTLQKLGSEAIQTILHRAITQQKDPPVEADDDAIEFLALQCNGDARIALNSLQMAMQAASVTEQQKIHLTKTHVQTCFTQRQASLCYDKNADMHYDCISAFHKSIRGSDANAALYWMARMLEGGENPLYVARRMIRIASEDIGLAAPECLPQAVAAYDAAHFIGMPECDVVLAQCATMLARAPKSVEVYKAYKRVKQCVHEAPYQYEVPLHLRNAPTKLLQELGHGRGYLYNPDHTADECQQQTYLPSELLGTTFFLPEDQISTTNTTDE